MRVSGDSSDADYWVLHFIDAPLILLDGVVMDRVIEADDQAGYLVRYVTSSDGHIAMGEDEFLTERLTGDVQFLGGSRRQAVT